ncbi:hypothetical protein CE91St25_15280 [Campylobacter ureolyticus]|uniref:hypothetical protein n=1 Tax=Campylobacter ureolyticus TaxID=827 RepID=UPI001FC850E5|nr:hypothetical protein [Campylobacter ureolyticus]GKH61192.1 hypothetical protein CE91St25_15280 [Campylobacter ureolyticus]
MKSKSFIWLTNTSGESKKQPSRLTFRWYLQHLKFILIVGFLVIFTGCGIKPEPVYKEVLIPVKCQAKMPVKPVNDGSFESHKNKMIYYLRCESTLKQCLGLTPLKGDKGD